MEYTLYVKDLSFRRSDVFALHLDSLSLKAGDVVALTGQSGCGKSTLLECIGLLHDSLQAKSFKIKGLDALSLKGASYDSIRRTAFGYMPQTDGLLPFLSVEQNIKVQIDLSHHDKDKEYRHKLQDRAMALCAALDIGHLVAKKVHEMSIGQRQRASFIRSIAHEPALLLIDEPTSALDPVHALELFAIIKEVVQKSSSAAVVVTHDHSSVERYDYDICSYLGIENGICSFAMQERLHV